MYQRVYNFSAGPAALPESVLQRVQSELMNLDGTGMSVMEMSHRSPKYMSVAQRAEACLRRLLDVPDDYQILFLQGGATLQFSAVPLNLARPDSVVDYFNTGSWSKKAIKEAQRHASVNIVADSSVSGFTSIPDRSSWKLTADAAYVHYTLNETIGGVEFHEIPEVGDAPLVTDASSTLLSRPLDVRRFGLIYAGAQKNIGPAGLTIVIVRDDLIGKARTNIPALLDYEVMAESDSMSNTPATFAWYVAGLVFDWIESQGGLVEMAKVNATKSSKLYRAIDESNFYNNPVDERYRSWMNIPFVLATPELDSVFLEQAKIAGLTNLKGHRSVGGMRASIYNAMPESGVDALIDFMKRFENDL